MILIDVPVEEVQVLLSFLVGRWLGCFALVILGFTYFQSQQQTASSYSYDPCMYIHTVCYRSRSNVGLLCVQCWGEWLLLPYSVAQGEQYEYFPVFSGLVCFCVS